MQFFFFFWGGGVGRTNKEYYLYLCLVVFQILVDNIPAPQFVAEMLNLLKKRSFEW